MDICVGQTDSENHYEGCPGRVPFFLCVSQCAFNVNPDRFPLFHHNGAFSARYDEQAIWHPVFILSIQAQNDGSGAITNSHTVNSHVNQLQEVFTRTNASRTFYFAASLCRIEHHLNHFWCCAFTFAAGIEPGGCFDEIRPGAACMFRRCCNLLQR